MSSHIISSPDMYKHLYNAVREIKTCGYCKNTDEETVQYPSVPLLLQVGLCQDGMGILRQVDYRNDHLPLTINLTNIPLY